MRELPDQLIDELLRPIVALDAHPADIMIESLHGTPKDTDRPGHRRRLPPGHVQHQREGDLAGRRPRRASTSPGRVPTAAAIEAWSFGSGYINYMQADEPIERVRAAFGDEAFERLQTLKRRYDPTNILRRNQNVPPD